MIVATLHCAEPDCRVTFAVTRRQRHPGLVAQVVRCPKCRAARRRLGQATWARRKRSLAVRRPEFAPVRAALHPAAVDRLLAAVYGDDERRVHV